MRRVVLPRLRGGTVSRRAIRLAIRKILRMDARGNEYVEIPEPIGFIRAGERE